MSHVAPTITTNDNCELIAIELRFENPGGSKQRDSFEGPVGLVWFGFAGVWARCLQRDRERARKRERESNRLAGTKASEVEIYLHLRGFQSAYNDCKSALDRPTQIHS